jgi:hypothetical protein
MMKRALAGQLADLMFTKDYREFLHGDLVPGHKVALNFDAERLPQVFSSPGAAIDCHVLFKRGGTPQVFPLHSDTGILTRKSGIEPGGGSMVRASITIPEDAEQFELWFTASVAGRPIGYDSDFGKNFAFPFVERDIRVRAASVAPVSGQLGDRFSVTVETARAVSGVALDYRVTNRLPLAATTTRVALQSGGSAPDGWSVWSTPPIDVPRGAVVSFSVTYTRANKTYFDDNNHRGYVAPMAELARAAQ